MPNDDCQIRMTNETQVSTAAWCVAESWSRSCSIMGSEGAQSQTAPAYVWAGVKRGTGICGEKATSIQLPTSPTGYITLS